MNTKHTPGQWLEKVYTDKSIVVRADNKGFVIAEITTSAEGLINAKQAEANARLIAAAPEMMQMIYDLKNCIERLTGDDALTQYDKDTEAQWIGEAHELLTKIAPEYYQNANA